MFQDQLTVSNSDFAEGSAVQQNWQPIGDDFGKARCESRPTSTPMGTLARAAA
jgi:hypothetical protein